MKITSKQITLGICPLVVLTGLGPVRGVGPEPVIATRSPDGEDPSQWAVQNKDQAIARIKEILGVSGQGDLQIDAKIVLLAEDNTPFLSGQVTGRPVWHVVISNWKLHLKSAPPDVKDVYTRVFDIFLGAEEGHLLKIVSRWPQGVPRIPPEPGPASYTDQVRRSGKGKYHGFPKEDPPIKFLDALDSIFREAGDPLGAEQIVGQYVVWSQMDRPPKPVWAITLRDTQPMWESAFPGAAVSARNHMRHIVDGRTGKCICAGSVPQPVTLEGKPTKVQEDQVRPDDGAEAQETDDRR
jgi:hypothetical protein